MPDKQSAYYQYNPPLVIASTTWAETKIPYGKMLYDNMLRRYAGIEDTVRICGLLPTSSTESYLQILYLEVDLDTTKGEDRTIDPEDDLSQHTNVKGVKAKKDMRATSSFFKEHPTAKMITVIDSHSLDNGFFAWKRTPGGEVEACRLYEVSIVYLWLLLASIFVFLQILRDCMPPLIFEKLTSSPTSKDHHNKSLILNLACGSTVTIPEALHSLLEG